MLLEQADSRRIAALTALSRDQRAPLCQFFTPPTVARFMAAMFSDLPTDLRLLDPGAGVGSLLAAVVERACSSRVKPSHIDITAYEIEPTLVAYLESTLRDCRSECSVHGTDVTHHVIQGDFIQTVSEAGSGGMSLQSAPSFNRVILNPPYRKIPSKSEHRQQLHKLGIEASNLYAGFIALAIMMLELGGELVAITPRSFCNGPHFRQFRRFLLDEMALQSIHVFDARDKAFETDHVLQENVIIHATKGAARQKVIVSFSDGPDGSSLASSEVHYDRIVDPNDEDQFIQIPDSHSGGFGWTAPRSMSHTLHDLGISVSTGRVVDFRVQQDLLGHDDLDCVPLIYPSHFAEGFIEWPRAASKRNRSIKCTDATKSLLLPAGWYVLVKRFTAKEERRRVVAAVLDPERLRSPQFGIENHVNVLHQNGRGMEAALAKGLAVFLNSSLLDRDFRRFSGHTQVNATDLRRLRFPSPESLAVLGARLDSRLPSQGQVDNWIDEGMRDREPVPELPREG
jgi:adenine-specific DNA-methyltransferase